LKDGPGELCIHASDYCEIRTGYRSLFA
jgi:hypothetical protein